MADKTLVEAALAYYARGWNIFPLVNRTPPKGFKWELLQNERIEPSSLVPMFSMDGVTGIAMVLGDSCGIDRLDIDGPGAAEEFAKYGDPPPTAEFLTPRGGRGYLFAHSDSSETSLLWKSPDEHSELRYMSTGSYTVIPPSVSQYGAYSWVIDGPVLAPQKRLAEELHNRYTARVVRELERELAGDSGPDRDLVLSALGNVAGYDDYDSWLKVGMALRSVDESLLPQWDEWSRQSSKYEPGACEKKWATFNPNGGLTGKSILHWAKEGGWNPPSRNASTDLGNSELFVEEHRGRLLYCFQWDKWLAWDDKRWKIDVSGRAQAAAKCTARRLFDSAAAAFAQAAAAARENEAATAAMKRAGKLYAHAIKSQSARSIEAMVTLARDELFVLPDALNRHSMLLNCENGTLDLSTGKLREPKKEDLITHLCPVEYQPDAICPRWERFMQEVFDGDRALILWVQKLLGYAITGEVQEHVLPVFHGTGRNGKSTIVRAVRFILGDDYSCVLPSGFLNLAKGEQHPTKLAELHGKRFAADMETGEGMRLDEELVKRLTGGDEVKARRMYEDFWSFKPTHKLFLGTNYEPAVQGMDLAIWSRLKLVPFKVSFLGREERGLDAKLAIEAPGILRWMVDGCAAWLREGLGSAPMVVEVATAEYRSDQDTLTRFFNEKLAIAAGSESPKASVTMVYGSWCQSARVRQLSPKALVQGIRKWMGDQFEATPKAYKNLKIV